MVRIKKEQVFLIAILILGFILRIWGINFGLPFQFHQDEPIVVNHTLAYGTGDSNPHFFAIPPLTSYLLFLIYGIYFLLGKLAGIFSTTEAFAISFFKDPSIFYLLGRLFIGIIPGTLSILFTYKLYKRIFSSSSGALFAASLVAFNCLNVADSHYIYTDMLLSLFIIIAILQLIKTYNLARLKNYILSGIFIGLAIGTKYNAAILIVPFLFTHLFICRNQKTGLFSINIIMGAIFLFLTLFITNPFMFLDFKFFINSFAAQAGASGYVGWLHHISYSLRESIGLLFFILGLLGMLLLTKENKQKGCLLFLFPIIFYLHLVFLSQPFPRYVIPLIPFFAIATGWLIFEYLIPKLKENLAKKFSVALIFLLFIPLIIKSIKVDILLSSKDTRIEAADWMKIHINSQSRIALDHTFFKPAIVQSREQLKDKYESLDRQSGLVNIKSRKLELMVQAQKKILGYYLYFLSPYFAKPAQFLAEIPSLPFDLDVLKSNNIDYVVINYAKRQKDTEKFYQALKDNAKLVVSFSPYSDGKVRFSYDMIATTAIALTSKEIYSRIKNGPALEIYELKK